MENKLQNLHSLEVGPHFLKDEDKIQLLEAKIQDLRFICDNLDPFAPITEEFQELLKKNNIFEVQNPFTITSLLLMQLEDSLEELHRLKDIPLE